MYGIFSQRRLEDRIAPADLAPRCTASLEMRPVADAEARREDVVGGTGASSGRRRAEPREALLPYFGVSVSLRAVTASVTRVVGFSSLSAPRIAASLCAPPAANTRTGAARTTSSGTDMTHWLRG